MKVWRRLRVTKVQVFGLIGFLLFCALLSPVAMDSFEIRIGSSVLSSWFGIDPLVYSAIMRYWIFGTVFIVRPFVRIYGFYKKTQYPQVSRKYESELLRLTFLLCSPEKQKRVYEPMYSDWQLELTEASANSNRFEVSRANVYYGSQFAWLIWREVGILRSYRMRKTRNRTAHSVWL